MPLLYARRSSLASSSSISVGGKGAGDGEGSEPPSKRQRAASADEAWLHVVDNPRTRKALHALHQAGMGEVAEGVLTLGCFQLQELLQAMTVELPGYVGWREAEAHFKSVEELGRRLKALGL